MVAAAVENFGRLDILFNNAGGFNGATILDMEEEQWNAVIDVQLSGVVHCTQHAARQMISQGSGGAIINMFGATGFCGMYGHANHAATKGAILAATRSCAFELRSHHIRVNAVRAKLRTELMAPLIDQIREHLKSAGEPHDVTARELEYYGPEEASGLVAWLASGLTSEITGQLFGIDGPKLTHYGVYRKRQRDPVWRSG
ncbi:SDR family oxidoreductase [Bradyrhizobium sp. 143]|uniref:SDR family NAD(P)-dependent oxidoreductase n=1 Tax=Bradyrhizobium sp. 143 TaxID=2782619 RepID=UPI00320960F6|nr:SDR family oxidoreductase [Bradyrhizobium sp. 143]